MKKCHWLRKTKGDGNDGENKGNGNDGGLKRCLMKFDKDELKKMVDDARTAAFLCSLSYTKSHA